MDLHLPDPEGTLHPLPDPEDTGRDAGLPQKGLTPERARTFLEALRDGETVRSSAVRAGVSHVTVYKCRSADPLFARLMEEAQRCGLQARARRRERKRAPFRAMRYRLVQMGPDDS